jgi:hypothetical protein
VEPAALLRSPDVEIETSNLRIGILRNHGDGVGRYLYIKPADFLDLKVLTDQLQNQDGNWFCEEYSSCQALWKISSVEKNPMTIDYSICDDI